MGKHSFAHRIRSKGLILSLALIAGCSACATNSFGSYPTLPNTLQVVPEVLQTMYEIQREFEVETARCLTGFIKGNIVYIQGMETTGGIMRQTPSSVMFKACTGANVVGWYHNHPEEEGKQWCAISSDSDLETLTYGRTFWVAIITCSSDTIVYRFKMNEQDYISKRIY